jgi:lipopolysaccharide transport system permease protein
LLGMMLFYRIAPTRNVIWLPLFTLLAVLTAFAVSLWLSALNVQYRDVQQAIPFLIMAWMYASPVAYSAELIPSGKWRFVYALNPMAGVIAGFRWALLGAGPPDPVMLVSVAAVLVLLVTGLFYFRRMERTFADVV